MGRKNRTQIIRNKKKAKTEKNRKPDKTEEE